jgi:tetratricopeptide (TPR) repeat protein
MRDEPGAILRINHLQNIEPAMFQLTRIADGKSMPPVLIPSPVKFPVEGRKDCLLVELKWYLESFLDFPFSPATDHAERVLDALRTWGEQAFLALFGGREGGRWFDVAAAGGYSNLQLQVASDDPKILAWPWEALRDPELGWLAHTCQVERRLNSVRDPQQFRKSLPKDQVNILLVVARPYGEEDVRFRSLARLLVQLIEKKGLRAGVELLRPPTFDRLREHLRERPDYYHILHFDGHGAYGDPADAGDRFKPQGPEGTLVFEDENGNPYPVTAEKLSALLQEHSLPAVVLNACQSAMVDAGARDPFASVATAMLRSGTRDVVAMAYSLYVSGAKHFLPAFYGGLFETGRLAEAVRMGRQQMWNHEKRICACGEFPLQDWLLPVLYRQEPIDFSFATSTRRAKTEERASKLTEELRIDREPYGFIGRDSAILRLERAMRRDVPAILIQGLGGVGKTSIARGFLQWLDATGGLDYPPFWLGFQEIRSAEYVFNQIGIPLFGANFGSLPPGERLKVLTQALRQNRFLIVWDNFESAAGIAGTAVSANLPVEDRGLLAEFLNRLRGGETKVLITSRSSEDWLGPEKRFLLPIGGFDGEERWEYCEAVLRNLGLMIDRKDKNLVELMDLLMGHPLAMRAILPRLEKMGAGAILAAIRLNIGALGGREEEALARIYATLEFVQRSLPPELRGLLVPLALHENYVDADYLEAMSKVADPSWMRTQIDGLMHALSVAGLLQDLGQATYWMHPLLTSYLRSMAGPRAEAALRERWTRAFVDFMGRFAISLAPRELHEQKVPFQIHGENFRHALDEAGKLGMETPSYALMQSMGSFAQNSRNFTEATRLYERLAKAFAQAGNAPAEAAIYSLLGMLAEEQRDFDVAERWYRKSLAITETRGGDHGAGTYGHLGTLAHRRGRLDEAKGWYTKAAALFEKLQDEDGAAKTYHHLGMVAQDEGELAEAESSYTKSLEIKERRSDQLGISTTCHQLGSLAQERGDFGKAQEWYLRSLSTAERLGDELGAARTLGQLGILTRQAGDPNAAERYYLEALEIFQRLQDLNSAASIYGNLGTVEALRGNFLESGRWYVKSILAFRETNDAAGLEAHAGNFVRTLRVAPDTEKDKLRGLWEEANLGPLPEEPAKVPPPEDMYKLAQPLPVDSPLLVNTPPFPLATAAPPPGLHADFTFHDEVSGRRLAQPLPVDPLLLVNTPPFPLAAAAPPPGRHADFTFHDEVSGRRSGRVANGATLQVTVKYQLEVAIRTTQTGIPAVFEAEPIQEPRRKENVKILVVADSPDGGFEIPEPVQYLVLPPNGDSRQNAWFKGVKAVRATSSATDLLQLRVRLYYNLNLIEVAVIEAEAVTLFQSTKESRLGLEKPIRFCQKLQEREYGDLELIEPRGMHILVSAGSGGVDLSFVLEREGREDVVLSGTARVPEDSLEDSLCAIRKALLEMTTLDYFSGGLKCKDEAAFAGSLRRLAQLGRELWTKLFELESGGALFQIGEWLWEHPLPAGSMIQVSAESGAFAFVLPWNLLYDRDLPVDRDALPDPEGFWGVRYQIEQRAATSNATDEATLPVEPVELGYLTWPFAETPLQGAFLKEMAERSQGRLSTIRSIDSAKEAMAYLTGGAGHIVCFFAHGHTQFRGAERVGFSESDFIKLYQNLPTGSPLLDSWKDFYDEIQQRRYESDRSWILLRNGRIYLSQLYQIKDLRFEKKPVVLLNMCESAQLTPSLRESFIHFFLDRGAVAVVGTECSMCPLFAHHFAKELLAGLLAGETLGNVMVETRKKFLGQRNPLGLAYTLFGSPTARFDPALVVRTAEAQGLAGSPGDSVWN